MLRPILLTVLCGGCLACSASTNAPPAATNDATPSDVGGGSDAGDSGGSPSATIVGSWVPSPPAGATTTSTLLRDVAFTKDGAVLVVGRFKGTFDFGKGALTAPDADDDGFIARLSYPDLAVQWTVHTNNVGPDTWDSIAVLPSGDAVVGGTIDTASAARALRVARISAATGDIVWAKTVTPTGSTASMANDSIIVAGGAIIASGTIEGTATLDSVTLTSSGYSDLYALALDESGTAKWGYVDGVFSADYRGYLAVDSASGDLLLSGMQGSPDRRLYVARLDGANGTKKWSRTIGSPGQAEGFRAVSDGTNVYAVGVATPTVEFDSDTQTKTGGGLVAAFQLADGNVVPWAITRNLGSGTERKFFRDAVVHNGKVVACGGVECVWLEPATGAVARSWSVPSFSSESSFGRVLVDGEGRLLIGGGAYSTITINDKKYEAGSFVYRPFLLVLKP
jgi:hypothetical protein